MGPLLNDSKQECADDEYQVFIIKTDVECICPKCKKRHTMQLHWTGDFTPRKYCKQCRSQVD